VYLQSARQCERDRCVPVDSGYYPDAVGLVCIISFYTRETVLPQIVSREPVY